ncbi:SUKH-3 domain-containing protein [Rubinisphaera sp. JC750]|uniref:SUKH-3 domain-containing protein n=1 Tax=Rubinisphaera sp. JC750 TaxID=2898658 RepID=UPI001F322172|nr:SUKH-3 domain-containing protein [Rubinisphaera sp. JC750]
MHGESNAETPQEVLQGKIAELFLESGWRPGVCRSVLKREWRTFSRRETNFAIGESTWDSYVRTFCSPSITVIPDARQAVILTTLANVRKIIGELFCLSIGVKRAVDGVQCDRLITIDPHYCEDDDYAQIHDLCKQTGHLFFPVGKLVTEATMLVDENGRVFLISEVACGVLFAGENFSDACQQIYDCRSLLPVVFDVDMDPEFLWTEEVHHDAVYQFETR